MSTDTVCTTCPYCGVGCGVSAGVEDGRVQIEGDRQHPANRGRLCVKGATLADTVDHRRRLRRPRVDGRETSWAQALSAVADGFTRTVQQYGKESVGFYVSGQLLTEDYYVANKLMKGFIGSGNIDTNSRLCMSSAVAAHKRAFGEDLVPGCYEDLEQADMVLLVGSNMAYTHPVVFQRLVAAKKARPELFIAVLDPRRTATCEMADLHLPLAPASDGLFFNGLLRYLAEHDYLDDDFINRSTEGFEAALEAARSQPTSIAEIAAQCDLDADDVDNVFQRFATTPRVVTVFCQGINQSVSGSDKGNAIINCHLASGKIGQPGAAPFSITGQPNAMGGREAGGLANTLAAHMEFSNPEDIDRLRRFWNAPSLALKPGLKAVELFEAVHAGKIRALWIMATNPVASMPDADFVREALRRCELVVVSDCYGDTDTAEFADILLPARTWGEKTGTVTNSERVISLQRAFLNAPGEARSDWRIISEVGRRMGFVDAFDYEHPADIFREHAALSGFENDGLRAFNIADRQTLSRADYMQMQPFQWPANQPRLFADGRFYTDNGKAHFIAIDAQAPLRPLNADTLIMNTGRYRDQWHTMSRTGNAAILFHHAPEPRIEIHSRDAARLQLADASLAVVRSAQAELVARIAVTDDQRPGDIFVPMHWNGRHASSGRVSRLVQRLVDPVSGQPQFKQTAVSLRPYPAILEGILLLAEELGGDWQPPYGYWSRVTLEGGTKFLLAETDIDKSALLSSQLRTDFPAVSHWLLLSDAGDQGISLAGFIDERLVVVLYTAADAGSLPTTEGIEQWLGKPVEMSQRFRLLEGSQAGLARGPTICSCHKVGETEIVEAINSGFDSVTALGERLKCGTNCGSCIPELQKLLVRKAVRGMS